MIIRDGSLISSLRSFDVAPASQPGGRLFSIPICLRTSLAAGLWTTRKALHYCLLIAGDRSFVSYLRLAPSAGLLMPPACSPPLRAQAGKRAGIKVLRSSPSSGFRREKLPIRFYHSSSSSSLQHIARTAYVLTSQLPSSPC